MLISLFAAALLAQAPAALPPKACRDDDHTNRCAPEVRARFVASLGMASAEAEAKAGVEAYRVFFVDGYGRDRPAIAFERRAGEPPKAVVYAKGRKIEAPTSAAAWTQVKTGARFADRSLEALPPPVGQPEVIMCLHAWVVSVEIAGAPTRDDGSDTVRTRTENACESGLATQFAYELAALAAQQFPACDALDKIQYRNDVERLATCASLSGDTLSAAELVNQHSARGAFDNAVSLAAAWRGWMGVDSRTELSWSGEKLSQVNWQENPVGKFLEAKGLMSPWEMSSETVEGQGRQQVRVTGFVYKPYPSPAGTRERATSEQIWVWNVGAHRWMLKSWTVGTFARFQVQ